MPKLIIKQNAGNNNKRKKHYGTWFSIAGLGALLITVAAAAFYFTQPDIISPAQEALQLDSASNTSAKTTYVSMNDILNELDEEYETLSKRGVDDYPKNLKLLGKSESVLTHLDKMDAVVSQLGLNTVENNQLLHRHQFYRDYWQAKSHFRQLRVSRFENQQIAKSEPLISSETAMPDKPKKFQFAKPPEGMALPSGFCDLSNPDSCKAEAPVDDLQPLPAANADKPKKFQFAKPPEGMELPSGFCDLSNPDSCKAEAPVDDLQPLPAANADKPKKFQFAKPPEGMELPSGFCDLSNPDSCKVETNAVIEQANTATN